MKRDCNPYLIDSAFNHHALTRIHFDDTKIAERFLQETIHKSPQILPLDRLDTDFSPPVSIGREIANIDNLLVSPTGKLSIVETKLWRNPEATRHVLAQLIEYANRLWRMEFDEFQELAGQALSPAPLKDKSLYELVQNAYPELVVGEADFHDGLQTCLNNAEFLLLVVGDGIRENLEGMTDMLYRPQMHFKFGLIEMQIFESDAIDYQLVIPSFVAHSTELRRTIIKIEGAPQVNVEVKIEEPPSSTGGPPRRVLSEEEFFAELDDQKASTLFHQLIEFGVELGARPLWRASSVGLRLPDPYGIRKDGFTLYLLNLNATVSDTFLAGQLDELEGDVGIAAARAKSLSQMFGIPYAAKKHALERGIPWEQISNRLDEFKLLMRNTVAQIHGVQKEKRSESKG